MTDTVLVALVTILVGGAVHAVIASYYYGRLSKMVEINTDRLNRLERTVGHHDQMLSRIAAICPKTDCGFKDQI